MAKKPADGFNPDESVPLPEEAIDTGQSQPLPPCPPAPKMDIDVRQTALTDMLKDDWKGPRIVANFDIRHPSGAKMFLQRNGRAEATLDALPDGKFAIRYWLAERRQFPTDDGKGYRDGLLLCLWDGNGGFHTSGSIAIARGLEDLCLLYGPGPYDPPAVLRVKTTRTRGNRTTYALDLISEPGV